ncbi:MAG: hypothetical protein E6K96_01275 [Thaumarchaeota archaeon]|nr:MAG: hypothetical protein E6K96_01275 [Nitrososphaerota archaeon]
MRRRMLLGFLPLLLAIALLATSQSILFFNAPANRDMKVRIGIPLNADDPSDWNQAIGESPAVGIIVLNPSNGPGDSRNPEYASRSQQAQARGIRILGYVHTSYANGTVKLETAKTWIDEYYDWYHVDGILLDEANATCRQSAFGYYQSLYQHIKAEPGLALVVLNPGNPTGECYAAISDVIVTFENDYANYEDNYAGANWTFMYPSSHFFHIVLNVPPDRMHDVISQAISRGAGWVYVTDLGEQTKNPYVTLPSYFDSEAEDVLLRNPTLPSSSLNYVPGVLLLGVVAAAVLASGAIFMQERREGGSGLTRKGTRCRLHQKPAMTFFIILFSSASKTIRFVFVTASGLTERESMPSPTRYSASSG